MEEKVHVHPYVVKTIKKTIQKGLVLYKSCSLVEAIKG